MKILPLVFIRMKLVLALKCWNTVWKLIRTKYTCIWKWATKRNGDTE